MLFDRSFDVTDEVLQKLDEELPVLNVNFVTPVAALPPRATPAQPAARAATAPTAKAKRR